MISREEMEEYEFMSDEFDEAPLLMVSASKRQEEIVVWLTDSHLAETIKGGSRSDFLVREGSPVRMKDGLVLEILSWLRSEEIDESLMVSGYTVTTGLDRWGVGEVMIFRKKQVFDAPFSVGDLSDRFLDDEDEEDGNFEVPDDDIPF